MQDFRGVFVLTFAILATVAICQEPSKTTAAPTDRENQPVKIPDIEIREHRLGHREQIHSSGANELEGWPGVRLELVVAPDGTVVSAKATFGPKEFYEQAVSLAKTWTYKPFLGQDGSAVTAAIRDVVSILPPQEHPAAHKLFPQVKDWKSLVITLERTRCFGMCPAYRVEIHGDGQVLYTGEAYVAITGEHRGRISQDDLFHLVEAFRSADYLSLKDKYAALVTDNPTYSTSIAFDGVSKKIVDYVGEHAGMPSAISELEDTIDRLAGTDKWLRGNADTAPSLVAEEWDFKAQDATHSTLLPAVAARGNVDAVRGLLALGVPVEGRDQMQLRALVQAAIRGDTEMVHVLLDAGAGANDKNEKGLALSFAARAGKPELVKLLLSRGAHPNYIGPDGATILMSAAQSGIPEIVAELLKFHPDVTAHDREGKTVLMHLDKIYGTADEAPGAKRSEVARLLVAAGADVNAQDNEGNTPLMEVPFDVDAARVLIEKGADVGARNKKGWTPLMTASNPGTVRLLLASGADPTARDAKGQSVLENARQFGGPEIASLIQAALAGRVEPAAKQ